MGLHVGSVVLGVEDVPRALAFWCAALGYAPREEPGTGWVVLAAPDGRSPNVSLMRSSTPVQARPRVHLDLYADDQRAEVARLVDLGATEVAWDAYPPDADFVVLADPEGNRFCVIAT